MKTFFNILVILIVAVFIGGLLYGTVTVFSSNSNQTQITERQLPPGGEFDGPRPDDEAGGLQFPVDSVKNVLIITAVGSLYLNASKLLGKRKSLPEVA